MPTTGRVAAIKACIDLLFDDEDLSDEARQDALLELQDHIDSLLDKLM